jgi:predicted permease
MSWWNDTRLAMRTWRRVPALAAVVILTLALGIGATTTAFTLAYTVLIEPLPFPHADRLVWVGSYNTRTSDGGTDEAEAGSNRMSQFIDWQQHTGSFEQLAAWAGAGYDIFTITGSGRPERVNGLPVTQQLLPMLGAKAELGTLFLEGHDLPDANRTIVLSHGFWQRRFAGRGDVLGQSITVDNEPYTIIGVVADDFPITNSLPIGASLDLYLPLAIDPRTDQLGGFMTVLGRLRPGVTVDQARDELAARQKVLAAERAFMGVFAQRVTPLSGPVTRDARRPLLLLIGGVGAILLMACTNLANLLLIRSNDRRKDIQLRAALGATMGRILKQTFTESCVLAFIGGGAGIAFAVALTRALRAASWLDLPRLPDTQVGTVAIAFAVVICAAIAVVFGSLPLLHVRRRDLMSVLRPYGMVTSDRRTARVQRVALVAQVGFAMALSVAGLLLFRSFIGLLQVHPGFRAESAVAMRVDPASRVRVPDRIPFFTRLLTAVNQVPGVQSAALVIGLPMDRHMVWDVAIPGRPFRPTLDAGFLRIVSPGYFRTVGIPIVSGRDFEARDDLKAPLVVAINQTLARQFDSNPIGRIVTISGRRREIVAVIADVKHRGLDADSGQEFYVPLAQTPGWQSFDLVVRAADPIAMVPSVRAAVAQVDPEQAIGTPVPLQHLIDRTVRSRRVLAWLLGSFAATALLLAALGVYGIVGYRVAQRTKETALRVALGASHWRVVSHVFGDALLSVALGVGLGLPLSLLVGNTVRAFLFGIAPQDPLTLAGSLSLLVIVTVIGAMGPARRAARVDVMATLRLE